MNMQCPLASISVAILLGLCVGCASSGSGTDLSSDQPSTNAPDSAILAYVGADAVQLSDLRDALLEAAGDAVLAEYVLDQQIAAKLKARGLTITPADIDTQQQLMAKSLSDDPDQAARLLAQLKRERSLGPKRFAALLYRNAALRKLTADDSPIPRPALDQAYALAFGPTYITRLIVVPELAKAQAIRGKLTDELSFIRQAMEHSVDPSRERGGLIAPINPADASWPKAVRDAVVDLQPGQVSGIVSLVSGYGLLRLERVEPGRDVKWETVSEQLEQQVRQRRQAVQMRQLAASLLADANVVVLSPSLNEAWKRRQKRTPSEAP